ncbi:hypothetical protein [Sinomicrobium soli]|uniref:hypothetical protein n=1 Tax=Sinomicrobium sp. N-1-3-6 TaxID=2219864 RepID=UPI0011BFDB86|nr:hypothetical protein [Sinomicrobium sp. N-1-3-6]
MDWWEIGKGVLCFLAVFVYFKYFNESLVSIKEKRFGDDYGDMSRLGDKIDDFGYWLGGILMALYGILIIYNELARNYGWTLFMAKE